MAAGDDRLSLQVKARVYAWALRRRIARALGRPEGPSEEHPSSVSLQPSDLDHARLTLSHQALAWRHAGGGDAAAWQRRARERLAGLLGVEAAPPCPGALRGWRRALPGGLLAERHYLRRRPGADIPVTVVSREGAPPAPPMLVLGGTYSAASVSWGEPRQPYDLVRLARGADMARQAVARGFAAVCVELAGFGARREHRFRGWHDAGHAVQSSLLFGHTLLGDRVADTLTVLNWLASTAPPAVCGDRPAWLLGHSAGGTVVLYTAAMAPPLAGCIASGCVGLISETLLARRNDVGENTVPGILRWLEMDDVTALLAPCPLLVVSGHDDHIWPYAGAARVVERAREVYRALGAEHALQAVAADGPHRFHPTETWAGFEALRRATSARPPAASAPPRD